MVGKPLLAEAGGKKIVVSIFALNHERIDTKNGKWFERQPQLWIEAIDANERHNTVAAAIGLVAGNFGEECCLRGDDLETGRSRRRRDRLRNRLYGFDVLTGQSTWPDRKLDDQPPLAAWFANLRGGSEPEVVLLREIGGGR